MKKLVIISGVTGAIGNACLAEFGRQPDTVVYGISRQAQPFVDFIDPRTGDLFPRTIIFSAGDAYSQDFIWNIDFNQFSEIVYIQAMGHYPFEVDVHGNRVVENDIDGDGVDDRCKAFTDIFINLVGTLTSTPSTKVRAVFFGSIADKHRPMAHRSFWQNLRAAREEMNYLVSDSIGILLLNFSSVICSHELITRPFVFTQTDANPCYWLTPQEVARKVSEEVDSMGGGFRSVDFFHADPDFNGGYYTNPEFTPRKVAEIFKK